MTEITHYLETRNVEITYDYQGEKTAAFEKVNRILSRLKLSCLELSEFEGYVVRRTCPDGGAVYTYVPETGKLICTRAKNGHTYQIDTLVEFSGDSDRVAQRWREAHPDRAMRTHIMVGYGALYGHIILHHPRIVKPEAEL